MKTTFNIFVLALLISFMVVPKAKAEVKIATVDMSRVLQEAPGAKSKISAIDKRATEAKAAIEKKKSALQALQSKLGKDNSGTSKDADEFRKASRDLQRYVRDAEEEIQGELVKVRKLVLDAAYNQVNKIAKQKNFDIVLEKSELKRGPVLFSKGADDITSDVVKALGG